MIPRIEQIDKGTQNADRQGDRADDECAPRFHLSSLRLQLTGGQRKGRDLPGRVWGVTM